MNLDYMLKRNIDFENSKRPPRGESAQKRKKGKGGGRGRLFLNKGEEGKEEKKAIINSPKEKGKRPTKCDPTEVFETTEQKKRRKKGDLLGGWENLWILISGRKGNWEKRPLFNRVNRARRARGGKKRKREGKGSRQNTGRGCPYTLTKKGPAFQPRRGEWRREKEKGEKRDTHVAKKGGRGKKKPCRSTRTFQQLWGNNLKERRGKTRGTPEEKLLSPKGKNTCVTFSGQGSHL